MSEKTRLPYEKIYKIVLERFIESIKKYNRNNKKITFAKYSYEHIINGITSYVLTTNKTETEKQKSKHLKETHNLTYKTQILLQKYKQTLDENIIKELLNINIEKIEKIISKKNYKNISREEMFEIAKEAFCDAIDEYINLNNTKISFQVYMAQMIDERLRMSSKKYIDTKRIRELLDLYEKTKTEDVKEELVILNLKRLNNIVEKFSFSNIPEDELLQVAIESLKYSIENFHKSNYAVFNDYSLNIIKSDLKKYIYSKTKEEIHEYENEMSLKI